MLIELGTCTKPHGIKGGFAFHLYSKDSVLKNGKTITIEPLSSASSLKKEGEEFKIKSISFGNKTICYLDGIEDRNIVEAMLPFKILYPRNRFPQLEEGEFYISDLVNMKVISLDGDELGVVRGHFDNGAQTVLSIALANEVIDVPFVEVFFPEVNIKDKKLIFVMPEFE